MGTRHERAYAFALSPFPRLPFDKLRANGGDPIVLSLCPRLS